MSDRSLPFAAPIPTADLAGFPDALTSVAQARRAVEVARMPAIRSQPAWLDAYNRLTLAAATGRLPDVEAARIALNFAALTERRGGRQSIRWPARIAA